MYLVKAKSEDNPWIHVLMVAALGIPVFFSLELFREESPWGRRLPRRAIVLLASALLLALYWTLLNADSGESRFLRYFQLSLAVHLAASFSPFPGRGEINGFWQFNSRIFQRAILSAVYAAVFFGGLALALAAVDNLFDARLNPDLYPRLWIFTVFVFQTWHFLGGAPSDLGALEQDREYPRGLKIFSQYMLVPLLALYLLILYVFTAKILLTRQWPQGWVGWLVSAASVFGVLTLLLLHPGREDRESRWIKILGRSFYVAILPLLGLLFAALAKRMGEYGLTERRYFLLVLGLWLTGLSAYMLFSKAGNIKVVPVSLCLTALLTSCGPWGAYEMSLASQSRRLEILLDRNKLLAEGKIVKAASSVPPEDLEEISSVVDYLVTTHGQAVLNRWSREDWTVPARARRHPDAVAEVTPKFMAEMGIEYARAWRGTSDSATYRSGPGGFDVSGFERVVPTYFHDTPAREDGPAVYQARFAEEGRAVEVLKGSSVVLKAALDPLTERLKSRPMTPRGEVPPADMTLSAESAALRVKICFQSLSVRRNADGTFAAQSGSGFLLVDEAP
jgi:hypothetical protein